MNTTARSTTKNRPAAKTAPGIRTYQYVSTNVAPTNINARKPGDRLKVAVDYLLAFTLLIVTFPVMIGAMLLVKLTSRGPAIYRQSRVGLQGRVFTIYKIRTMTHDCESLTGPRWAIPGDPRVTSIGRILRTLHLDELPQLFNVLRGDMSLVGPRPERPEICKDLRKAIPSYDVRHDVKPGITGYAQIHLPPDSCIRSVRNKLAYDRFYILKRGPMLEAYILFATLLKMCGLKKLYRRAPRKPAGEEE